MEYLMTYSWAILVVMLVGIAMWLLGIFNLGSSTSTTYTGFSRIKPQLPLTSVTADGNFTGVFTNGAGGGITLTEVKGPCTFNLPTELIKPGENFMFTGTGCAVSGMRGDTYELELEITYNLTAVNMWVMHTDVGKIHGPLE